MKRLITTALAVCLILGMLAGCNAPVGLKPAPTRASRPALDQALIAQADSAAQDFASGSGTQEDPYCIENAGQLILMIQRIEQADAEHPDHQACYQLTADISLNDSADWQSWGEKAPAHQWYPNEKRSFEGTFDGNGHTISGLYCYGPVHPSEDVDSMGLGLFNHLSGATVKNVTFRESYIHCTDTSYAGMAAAHVSGGGRILGCVNEGIVNAPISGAAGGLAGSVNGSVEDCVNRGSVNGHGGVVGLLFGTVRNCRNEGRVTSTEGPHDVGGVAGSLFTGADGTGAAVNCENSAPVHMEKDTAWVGGLFGSAYSDDGRIRIEDCSNSGQVTAEKQAGGLIGVIWASRNEDSLVELERCTNTGALASRKGIGGICSDVYAEQSGTVTLADCVNRGSLMDLASDEDGVTEGGIVGTITMTTSGCARLERCMNASELHSESGGLGGVVAHVIATGGKKHPATITLLNCENHGNISGSAYGMGGILGHTTLMDWTSGNEIAVEGCVNTGDLYYHSTGSVIFMGGITGNFMGAAASKTVRLEDCYNSGDILCDAVDLEISSDTKEIIPAFGDGIAAKFYRDGILSGCESSGRVEVVNGPSVWMNTERKLMTPDGNLIGEKAEKQ